jgi:DNA-binding PadR family transcriptional regulator
MQADWPSENIILGLLCERPLHGYELARLVQEDEGLRAIWRIERSEVYFLLGKLRQRAYIAEHASERPHGPARTIYAPTEAGRAVFEQWLHSPEPHARNLRTALLARVYMALRHDAAVAIALIDAQKLALSDWLERERQRKIDNAVIAMVHRLRAAQVEATLAALDDLRRLAIDQSAFRGSAGQVDYTQDESDATGS